jgi:hypothetical protein
MNLVPPAANVRAELRLCATSEGGRTKPILSGYRPGFWWGELRDGQRQYYSAAVFIEDVPEIGPGDMGTVRLHPGVRKYWKDVLLRTLPIEMSFYEGSRLIGYAKVIEILPL